MTLCYVREFWSLKKPRVLEAKAEYWWINEGYMFDYLYTYLFTYYSAYYVTGMSLYIVIITT